MKNNPVLVLAAVRALILCAVSFGLTWTVEEIASIMLALEAIAAIYARAAVTPNHRVELVKR